MYPLAMAMVLHSNIDKSFFDYIFSTVGQNTKEDVPAGNGNGITQ